jgi:hypothetical protein
MTLACSDCNHDTFVKHQRRKENPKHVVAGQKRQLIANKAHGERQR